MRVIFFGTAQFAVPSLEALGGSAHPVVMCVTQPDRLQGRGLRPEPSPVKRAAVRLGLPLAQPERPDVSVFRALQSDVGVVAAYGELIRRDLLMLPARGMIGVHPSLLPHYRGAAPVAWALLKGETTTGVTIFQMTERLDAGDIVCQESAAIQPDDTTETLTRRLAELGAQVLLRALEQVDAGRPPVRPQDDSQATLAPKLTKAQGRIRWTDPAIEIERLVRATVPWPGATTTWQGRPLRLWATAARKPQGQAGSPGTVMQAGPDAITVATGSGLLDVLELQPAGKRRMTTKEFLAGHRMQVGDRVGR